MGRRSHSPRRCTLNHTCTRMHAPVELGPVTLPRDEEHVSVAHSTSIGTVDVGAANKVDFGCSSTSGTHAASTTSESAGISSDELSAFLQQLLCMYFRLAFEPIGVEASLHSLDSYLKPMPVQLATALPAALQSTSPPWPRAGPCLFVNCPSRLAFHSEPGGPSIQRLQSDHIIGAAWAAAHAPVLHLLVHGAGVFCGRYGKKV